MDKLNNTTSNKKRHAILGTVIKVNGRTVGQVIGDTFVKDITNRHMLSNPEAIANNIQALHDAEHAGAVYCEFTNTDTGIVYRAAIAKIWDMGKPFNYGYGDQIYLTLSNWLQTVDTEYTSHTDTTAPAYADSDGTHEVKPLNIKSNAPKGSTFTKGKQLSLFGGR